jgi:hypothetical protein
MGTGVQIGGSISRLVMSRAEVSINSALLAPLTRSLYWLVMTNSV